MENIKKKFWTGIINKKYGIVIPRNESGVIFLFGACHKDFGFEALIFNNCYPDASAKCRMLSRRVKIEFEFISSNFLMHKHEAGDVDLIICWKHDTFSIEKPVLELMSGLLYIRESGEQLRFFDFRRLWSSDEWKVKIKEIFK